MPKRRLGRLLVCVLSLAWAGNARAAAPANPEAPAWALDPKVFAAAREKCLAQTRAAFLDGSGRSPLPTTDFPDNYAVSFATQTAELKSLAAQTAYVRLGRGPEDMSTYADMVVHLAARLGVDPPESALPIYRGRARPAGQALTPQQEQGFSELTAAVRDPGFRRRAIYIPAIFGKPASARVAAPAALRGAKGKRRRSRRAVAPPPEPQGPPRSVLESIDWKRADELAAAAASGADGWSRKTRRRRKGRCYEWVRMALQKTGLWTEEFRSEVSSRGDSRRPRRAYSFAWAMNKIESRIEKDPFIGRPAPLRRLDLRVDPLVKGSIVVFDRNACGFNSRSGHIEVITSIEPLRASSYKFHEVKLDCLAKAADAGQVHIYVPQRLDPYPPKPEPRPAAAPAPADMNHAPAQVTAALPPPAGTIPAATP